MAKRLVFKAIPAAHINDEEAQQIGDFLERKVGLGRRPCTAAEIVEAGRPADSVIHDYFEWDDSVAAHEYRLTQARYLVRCITVERETPDGEVVETRAFHHVKVTSSEEGDGGGYVSQRVVWQQPEFAKQVRERALAELELWRQRYEQYEELSDLHEGVRRVLDAA